MKKFLIAAALLCGTALWATSCTDEKADEILTVENTPTASAPDTGGTQTFMIKSNASWNITKAADATWISKIDPTSGTGDATITVTIDANTSGSRSAALTVASTNVSRSVTISQAAVGEEPEPIDPGQKVEDLGDGSNAYEVKGNVTLKADTQYNLRGFVYVTDGAVLTIEPGTVIKGEKKSNATLIVERGGKIIAEGTKEKPIVFTSQSASGARKPGDWGGLIILGKAPNNKGDMSIEGGVRSMHGGTDAADNSGILKYVRIEFAGIEYSIDNEINGLTLGSVGNGTVIDYVQVSHSGDDSFEWFGGTVNARHIIAYGTWDDCFDADNGFSGNVQYALSVRNPRVADKSGSNGFESDNNSDGAATSPYTAAVFANVSLFGPVATAPAPTMTNWVDNGKAEGSTVDARFQAAVQLRRNTQLSVYNSLFASWPIGLIIENDKGTAQTNYTAGNGVVKGNIMAGMVRNYQDKQVWTNNSVFNAADPFDTFVSAYYTDASRINEALTFDSNLVKTLKLSGNPTYNTPLVFPATDSVLATGADWNDSKVATGFDQVAYRGAFSPTETASNNWASGWANFDAQNTTY